MARQGEHVAMVESVAGAIGKPVVAAAKSSPYLIARLRRPTVLFALQDPKSTDDEVLVRVENTYPATLLVRLVVVTTTRTFIRPPQRTVRANHFAHIVVDTRGPENEQGLKRRGHNFDVEVWLRKPGPPTGVGRKLTNDYCFRFSVLMDTTPMGAELRWILTEPQCVCAGNAEKRGLELMEGWKLAAERWSTN